MSTKKTTTVRKAKASKKPARKKTAKPATAAIRPNKYMV